MRALIYKKDNRYLSTLDYKGKFYCSFDVDPKYKTISVSDLTLLEDFPHGTWLDFKNNGVDFIVDIKLKDKLLYSGLTFEIINSNEILKTMIEEY